MKKRIVYVILLMILLICFPLIACSASPGDSSDNGGSSSSDFKFELSFGKSYTVTEYVGNKQSVTIPSTYKGKAVTSIGHSAFEYCESITSITFPTSITDIDDYAFYGCDGLTSVTLPDGLTSIGSYAFSNCDNLKSISIPAGVTYIGQKAFFNCPIESATMPTVAISNVPLDSLKTVVINGGVNIPYWSFAHSSTLTSITIPNSVISIGDRAFYGCTSLTSITIPKSVTNMGEYIFSDCDQLTIYCEATSQPSSWIDYWNSPSYCPVVWNCKNNDVADDLYVYTVVDGIRYGLRYGCAEVVAQPKTITSANIPSSITYKGKSYSVETIRRLAFSKCQKLNTITIPKSVLSIGDSAFYNCDALSTITIPNSVTSIGNLVFEDCDGITRIAIPKSVTKMGKNVFSNCDELIAVYCEAQSKPSGWNYYWEPEYPTLVHWGSTGN